VKYLLAHGADINLAGGRHDCALQASICRSTYKIAKFLLERGANVNAEGGRYGTALIAAAGKGRWMILKLLLEKGGDVNRTSKDYGTAMYQCLKKLINQLYFPRYLGNELSMRHMERAATGIHRLIHGGADPNISGAS
jgi:ankyrin repeat protein